MQLTTNPVEYKFHLLGKRIKAIQTAGNITVNEGHRKRGMIGQVVAKVHFFDKPDERFFKIWFLDGGSVEFPEFANVEVEAVAHDRPAAYSIDDEFPDSTTVIVSKDDGNGNVGDRITQGHRVFAVYPGNDVVVFCLIKLHRHQSKVYNSNRVDYKIISNCHWSDDSVSVCVDDDHFGEGQRVDYNWGGGGFENEATRVQIATANAAMHTLAAEILALFPEEK